MNSDENIILLQGHIVSDPVLKDGILETSIASVERWLNPETRQPQEHTNYIGLTANASATAGKTLAQCSKGSHIQVRGRLRTEAGETGPRGGKTTKTKVRCVHILRLAGVAPEPKQSAAK